MSSKLSKKPAVIFDIDGTLACRKAIDSFCESSGWCDKTFWDIAKDLPANEPVAMLYDFYGAQASTEIEIIVLTARPEAGRQITHDWLMAHGFYYDQLLMMTNEDYTFIQSADRSYEDLRKIHSEGKERQVAPLLERYNVVAAFDDAEENIIMFVDMGIPGFLVKIP